MRSEQLRAVMECVVCSDPGIVYYSDLCRTDRAKHLLVMVPLRLGLDRMNGVYVASLLQCFKLKECVGVIGGKPRRSLYLVGNQGSHCFYLDPHTVFPTPCGSKKRLRKMVFHCKDINSAEAGSLDPSMAIAFFVAPGQQALKAFWDRVCAVFNAHPMSILTLSQQRPDYQDMDEEETADDDCADAEWE